MVLVGRFIVLLVLVKVMMSVWVAVGVLLGAFWGDVGGLLGACWGVRGGVNGGSSPQGRYVGL